MTNPASPSPNDDPQNRKRKTSPEDSNSSPGPTPKCSKTDNNSKCPTGAGSGGGGDAGPPKPVTIVERVTPCKSPNDPNVYRVIRLSNGLTAILISRRSATDGTTPSQNIVSLLDKFPGLGTRLQEPTCCFIPDHLRNPQSSHNVLDSLFNRRSGSTGRPPLNFMDGPYIPTTTIAVSINAGAMNDPVDCQGLAHFTEHMVHYGSRRFPKEDAVWQTVSNFGDINAFTMQHLTCYYNSVPDDMLAKNLPMFSGMLSEPLFELDMLGREVNAVDSEFNLRLPLWRSILLLAQVAIQNQDHPLAKFSCGNTGTLTDCKGGNGKRMQNVMSSNHRQNYVASAMTLAMNSTKSIDEMEELTLANFSTLLQGEHQVLHQSVERAASDKLILQNTLNNYIYLQGDNSLADLSMTWLLPASVWLDNPNERVVDIIYEMLADTSPHSLDAYLRNEGLVWLMAVGVNTTHYATIFQITLCLTDAGRRNTGLIVQDVFAFIQALRGNTQEPELRRLFEEIRISKLREFHYGSQSCRTGCAINCAMRLQESRNLGDVLVGESWKDSRFNCAGVMNGLTLLSQRNNAVIIETIPKTLSLEDVKARENSQAAIQTAPHSGGRYLIVKNKKELSTPGSRSRVNQFVLPQPNMFLREEYEKRCSGQGSGDNCDFILHTPENCGDIRQQELRWESKKGTAGGDNGGTSKIYGIHLGHKKVSNDPYLGHVGILFSSPVFAGTTCQSYSLAILWSIIINIKMNSRLSELYLGGFQVFINPGTFLHVRGFPKHMEQVVEAVVTAMLDAEITENEFRMGKDYIRVLLEQILSQDYFMATYFTRMLMRPMPSIDLLGTIKDLTLDELNCSIQAFRRSSFAIVLLLGNLHTQTFQNIATMLDGKDFGPQRDVSLMDALGFGLSQPGIYTPGEKCIRVRNRISNSFTTSVANTYIIGPVGDEKRALCFEAAMFFINCEAFMYLRTRKQLGYVVSAGGHISGSMRVPILTFTILVTCTAKKLTQCEVDTEIDIFISQYGEAIKNIDDEIFNRMKTEMELPSSLTKEEVGNWFNSVVGPDFTELDPRYRCALKGIRKVTVQVISGNREACLKPCPCEKCSNIQEWKLGEAHKSKFEFAVGKGPYHDYYISNPNEQ